MKLQSLARGSFVHVLKRLFIHFTAYYSNLEINVPNKVATHTNFYQEKSTTTTNIGILASYFNGVSHSDILLCKWFLVEATEECLNFMYFDKELINGIQVARNISINKDLTWQVKIHGTGLD